MTRESSVHQEVPIFFPGFIAVSLRGVTEKYGGINENVIKKFEQSALRLNEEMMIEIERKRPWL